MSKNLISLFTGVRFLMRPDFAYGNGVSVTKKQIAPMAVESCHEEACSRPGLG